MQFISLLNRRIAGASLLVLLALGGAPNVASAFWNHDWSYRKQITLDPAAAGISGKDDLADVPVLVRLHEGIFKFTDANSDGSDIRFVADDDKTPLKFQIEKYDSVFNLAFIWVMVPKVHLADKTNIWMYFGNTHATSGSEPRETYDPDQVLVYHFAERGTAVQDSTGYANNSSSIATPDEAGLIGNGAKFSGQNLVSIPTSASLALAAGASGTIAFWIKPSAASADAVVYSRHDGARVLEIGLAKGAPYVRAVGDGGQTSQTAGTLPLGDKAWHHIAVTLGSQLALFVDGVAGPVVAAPTPALNTPANLGGDAAEGASAANPGGYVGELDELAISKVARAPAYLQLLASDQGPSSKLLEYGADQQLSSWSSGYVGIILRSVTLDGWVVIFILLVMAALSWIVMFSKGRQLGRAAEGNRAFMRLFRKQGGDFGALVQSLNGTSTPDFPEKQRLLAQDAPLYRMFGAGMTELRQRVSADGASGDRNVALTAQSIEAIRASMDSSLVDELDSFDERMVMLTIAISGGPFLGLLGTVVGVMITFAAIAASGDVNINSIAPGIAAALVATVAGLIVAIPSLFGYNLLTSRIRRMTAQMQVFVDTMITRTSEHYPARQIAASGGALPLARPTSVGVQRMSAPEEDI